MECNTTDCLDRKVNFKTSKHGIYTIYIRYQSVKNKLTKNSFHEEDSIMKINKWKFNILLWLAIAFYTLCGGLTGAFYESDFSTIILPITVYVLCCLLITNLLSGHNKIKLMNLNNVALLSYGLSYITFYPISNNLLDRNSHENLYLLSFSFLSLFCIFVSIIMIFLVYISSRNK